MTRLHTVLEKLLELALILLMAVMVLDVLWQVATRFLFGDPSVWTEELARFILIWLGTLGAAYGVAKGFHLEMDYLLNKLKGTARKNADRIILGIIALVGALVFLAGGLRLVWLTAQLSQTSPALGLPMSGVYAALPLSGVLIVFFAVHRMVYPLQKTSQPTDTDL